MIFRGRAQQSRPAERKKIIDPDQRTSKDAGRHGKPEIFNTDQGSQFTGLDFASLVQEAKVLISMDGKGAWRDNVFVERLWRSVKYEEGSICAPMTASLWRARRSAAIWRSTTHAGRIRALTGARPTRPT